MISFIVRALAPAALTIAPLPAISSVDAASAVAVDVSVDLVSDYPFAPNWDSPDGNDDAVADLTVFASGTHTITKIDIEHLSSSWYLSTGPITTAKVGIADAADASTLLNAADGTVAIPFSDSISLRAYMMAAYNGTPMPRNDGDVYQVTIELDGSSSLVTQFSYPIPLDVVDTVPLDTSFDTSLETTPILTPTAMPGTGGDSSVVWVAAGFLAVGSAALGLSRRRPARAVASRATPQR